MKATMGTFTQVPNIFFDTCELPETAQVLYLRLLRHVGYKNDQQFVGSVRKLANLVHMPKSTVERMLKSLEEAKLIETGQIESRELDGKIPCIKVLIDDLWKQNQQLYAPALQALEALEATPKHKKPTGTRLMALQSMPYSEYLKSQEWQEKRKKALRFASFRCQLCNSPERLNVHHRTYEHLGQELMGDLITLCNDCHAIFHQNRELAE
jgi:hypothetical protein